MIYICKDFVVKNRVAEPVEANRQKRSILTA